MPAQTNEATLVRFKTGDDASSLSTEIIDMLFDEAEAKYGSYSRNVIKQAVIVERYRNLVASSRQDVTYKQNETSENISDISKGYAQDLDREEAKLASMISSEGTPAYIVATRRIPSKNRDMP